MVKGGLALDRFSYAIAALRCSMFKTVSYNHLWGDAQPVVVYYALKLNFSSIGDNSKSFTNYNQSSYFKKMGWEYYFGDS